MTTRHQKLLIALQHYLYGAKYYTALKAFDLAKRVHTGYRKDGITPEFQHQVEIALYIITLRDIEDEEGAIVCALLHDILEDYDHVTTSQLRDLVGIDYTNSVIILSKNINGMKTYGEIQEYYDAISNNKLSSIAKGCDRIHNLGSMVGVFTPTKQETYIYETEHFFLPLLKDAAGQFPKQHLSYMNIRTTLKLQVELIKAVLDATNEQ